MKSLEDLNVSYHGITGTGGYLPTLLAPFATSLVQLVISLVVKGIKGIKGGGVKRAGSDYIDKNV